MIKKALSLTEGWVLVAGLQLLFAFVVARPASVLTSLLTSVTEPDITTLATGLVSGWVLNT
ncbi:MAG: hypothetical protein WCH00_00615 [Candidatus Saccharibacteria bacterium]